LDAARQQPIETLRAADLGLAESEVGAAGSPTWVAEIRAAPSVDRPAVKMLEGPVPELAARLAERIERVLAARPRPALARVPAEPRPRSDRAIWVVVERRADGAAAQGTAELLGHAALTLADPRGAEVVAVHVGPVGDVLAAECAAAGADAVLALEHEGLSGYTNEAWAAALSQAIEARRPKVVLFSSTERGRDFAPRVAARLG